MKESVRFRATSRYVALFLLAILFTQYSIVCISASASPFPKPVEASTVIQSDNPASMENHCAKTGCVHTCHFMTMSTPDQKEGFFLPESQQTCRESGSPLTAIHAVFHPPRLF